MKTTRSRWEQHKSWTCLACHGVTLAALARMALSPRDPKARAHAAWLGKVKARGIALEDAPEELKRDWEVVLQAVGQHGDALQFAAEELCGDRESFLDSGREKGFVLKYASDDLKRDREIVLVDVDAAARSRKTHVEVDDHGRQSLGLRRW